MNRKSHQINKIERLKFEFGETNLNSKELVSPTYRKEINRKYYDKQTIFVIDGVLALLSPEVRKMIKKEVYQICNSVKLKELCYNCKVELIIAVICLYVWRTRHKKLRIEQTKLWNYYSITWRKYALIVANILQKTRENNPIK